MTSMGLWYVQWSRARRRTTPGFGRATSLSGSATRTSAPHRRQPGQSGLHWTARVTRGAADGASIDERITADRERAGILVLAHVPSWPASSFTRDESWPARRRP